MPATVIITVIVATFVLFIVVSLFSSKSGRPGGTDSTSFPYDTNINSIAPPSWTPDSGDSNTNDAQCEVSDSGWSDSGDSGSCDSGDSGGSDSGGGGD